MQLTVRTTAEGHPALSKEQEKETGGWVPALKGSALDSPPYNKLE